jgi:hypothetical protein
MANVWGNNNPVRALDGLKKLNCRRVQRDGIAKKVEGAMTQD